MAGRPRSFDKDQALLIAMERFWRDGYEATTIATLTEAMGINAPSLYAAFGDKDRLFAQAAAATWRGSPSRSPTRSIDPRPVTP